MCVFVLPAMQVEIKDGQVLFVAEKSIVAKLE
jgi:hypothetical protein